MVPPICRQVKSVIIRSKNAKIDPIELGGVIS